MAAEIIIHEATGEDRRGLEACFGELQAFELSIEPNRVEPDAICARYIDHLIAECAKTSGAILVAEVDHAVAGFVCVLARVRSDNVVELEPGYAYITDLVVLESHRQSGIGSALMQAAEAYAKSRGATRMRLGVLAGNINAHRLYRALGYSDNEVILEKRITPLPKPH